VRTKDGNPNDYGDLPMFTDRAFARNSDPLTSHEAADGVTEHLPLLEGKVFKAIASNGSTGMNIHEVEASTGIPIQTCSPRLAPLRRKGFILDSGYRRPGGTGRKQIVWIAKLIRSEPCTM